MSTISSVARPSAATGTRIKGFGSLAAVRVMADKQAKQNAQVTGTGTLLDDGIYGYASKTGTGAGAVMLFTNTWSSSTGVSGTMLDYYV